IMPPRMRTRSAGRLAAESLGGGTGVRVGRGGRGRRPREDGVNGNVEGANGGAPDFSTIIAQQLQNENVGNVIVNGNQVGCSYKEFLACNPKEYDGKGGAWKRISDKRTKNQAKNDKTEHGMEKRGIDKVKSK
ncbi:hypothetical protein Tco_1527581, partial [Tanacetum coccineum]